MASPPSRPEPAGFGECGSCAYASTGPAAICSPCAQESFQPVATDSCPVCDQRLPAGDSTCSNFLCRSDSRSFERSYAVAMKTGPLETAIYRWKFNNRWAWGIIFARVLLGFLYERRALLSANAIIVPSPTFLPPGADEHSDYAGFVIRQAIAQDDRGLPFQCEPRVIVKTAETRKLKELGMRARRDEAAALQAALHVPQPSLITGRDVWVYDAVATALSVVPVVKTVLRDAGAARVFGLTLARQPWK
jgi:predicted amidophosphoribosyltransferase